MTNPVDNRKINNDAWLKRIYHQSLRDKIINVFAPFYCSHMNINIFDEKIEVQCDIHNSINTNKGHYEFLLYVKNIITWMDAKYGYCNKNVKTSYIHNNNFTTRLYLHCGETRQNVNNCEYEKELAPLNVTSEHDIDTSQTEENITKTPEINKGNLYSTIFRKCAVLEKNTPRSQINTNNRDFSNSEQESNDDINTENISNLDLETSTIGYDSSSISEISDKKIKLGNKSKKSLASSIIRKRFNTGNHSENESKRKKLDEMFFSDNEESNSNNDSIKKSHEVTKGDFYKAIFWRAIKDKKTTRSQTNENENSLNSTQESNDDINSDNRSNLDIENSTVGYDSSSISEKSNKNDKSINKSKKSLKLLPLERKIVKTARLSRNEPNSSNNDELNLGNASTRKIDKKVDVQKNKEKPQNHSVSPKKNLANNCSKKKVNKSIYLRNAKGETQLHTACAKGNYSLVNSLLSQGFNPNVKDNAGWTPMHEAVKTGCLEVIKELIEYGAYLNAPGFEYETPLYTAIKYNKNDVAALLLQNGADTKCINIYGNSAQCINEKNWLKLLKNYKTSSTSLQNSRIYVLDKITVFLSNISLNKVTVNKFCKRFDIKLINNLNHIELSQVTHIIVEETENNTCNVNFECLIGIANGLFIVNENWISDSLKEDKLLDCETYEVIGTSSFIANGPKKSRLNKEKLCPKLFDGINIHISGNTGWKQFSLDQLNKLVLQFGAKILKRMPNPEDCVSNIIPYHCRDSKEMYCVSNIILYTKESSRLIKYNMKHLKAFPISWFLEAGQKYSII